MYVCNGFGIRNLSVVGGMIARYFMRIKVVDLLM